MSKKIAKREPIMSVLSNFKKINKTANFGVLPVLTKNTKNGQNLASHRPSVP